jgi:hypothetical protein
MSYIDIVVWLVTISLAASISRFLASSIELIKTTFLPKDTDEDVQVK